MTLKPIVACLGGDLYAGGRRANVPAPGHSDRDRSVSLLLQGERVLLHSFGDADWRAVRDHLRAQGFIDAAGRMVGGPGSCRRGGSAPPDQAARIAAARRLWNGAGPVGSASLSRRHLLTRAIEQDPAGIAALRHHPAAPVSVYGRGRLTRPALLAAIEPPTGGVTAVELVYLSASGAADQRLRLPRKTIGILPPGAAVRLAGAAPVMLVGEGVMTVLSASERLRLPAWALLSARNLAGWTPPEGVRSVVIAADRGEPGEGAAQHLRHRLTACGVAAAVTLPSAGADDWNTAAVAERRKEGG